MPDPDVLAPLLLSFAVIPGFVEMTAIFGAPQAFPKGSLVPAQAIPGAGIKLRAARMATLAASRRRPPELGRKPPRVPTKRILQ